MANKLLCPYLDHIQKRKPQRHTGDLQRDTEIYCESYTSPNVSSLVKFVLVLSCNLITSTSKDTSRTVSAEPLTDFSCKSFILSDDPLFRGVEENCLEKMRHDTRSATEQFAQYLIFSENNPLSLNTMQMCLGLSINDVYKLYPYPILQIMMFVHGMVHGVI